MRGGIATGRARAAAWLVGTLLFTLACAYAAPAAHAAPAAPAATAAGSIGTWGRGAWSWFGDPRAVSVPAGSERATFVGWIDWAGHVTVGSYDPRFGLLTRKVVGSVYHDDHSDPSILVEPDRRLTAFWSSHNGTQMYFRTTVLPENIGSWGPLQHVPSRLPGRLGFTYPNPMILTAEHDKLYLFWRGADWSADYATRSASGRWSAAHPAIVVPGQRPYLKADSDGHDTIALAFTDGHPRNVLSSVYFAEYHSGWLRHASGRPIVRLGSHAISPAQADLVYDARATRVPAWVWDTAVSADDRPVIVFATFPSATSGDYWYARWNGRRWTTHLLTDAGPSISPGTIEYEYSGGIALDHSNPAILYLSRKVRNGWQIERWSTSDGGAHWRHYVVVPADGTDNVRPVVPRGSDQGAMRLLWLHGSYHTYTTYRTTIQYLR